MFFQNKIIKYGLATKCLCERLFVYSTNTHTHAQTSLYAPCNLMCAFLLFSELSHALTLPHRETGRQTFQWRMRGREQRELEQVARHIESLGFQSRVHGSWCAGYSIRKLAHLMLVSLKDTKTITFHRNKTYGTDWPVKFSQVSIVKFFLTFDSKSI